MAFAPGPIESSIEEKADDRTNTHEADTGNGRFKTIPSFRPNGLENDDHQSSITVGLSRGYNAFRKHTLHP